MMQFICYAKCSTCKKAQAFLDSHELAYTWRDIAGNKPSEKELRAWHRKSGLPLKKFFNTSGLKYKELGLAAKLATMSEAEQFQLLSSDGMLVKRPLLIGDGVVLVGFQEKDWATLINS